MNLESCLLSPRHWAIAAVPLWATGRPDCGGTSKCCLRSACSTGWAPADRLWPSALMTYRLELCGIHVSGQCHGPTAKTVGEGGKAAGFSLSCQTEDWPLDCVTSRFPPTDHKWRMWKANAGRRRGIGGELSNLKGFHPVNWKDIIFWPGDALREAVHYGVKTEWAKENEREKRKGKEERIEASAGNSVDKEIVWFLNIICSFSVWRITSDAPLTLWKCSAKYLSVNCE